MTLKQVLSGKQRELKHFLGVVPYILSNFRCHSPRQVDIELSNRCNLRCRMCWFHGENGIGDQYEGQELSTGEVIGLIDQLRKYRPRIYIGGSEPFIRGDLPAILKHVSDREMPVSFTTNGTLVDSRDLKMLVELGIDMVSFSIDGNEETHDSVRGAGTYQEVTSRVKQFSQHKKEARSAKPAIAVNVTITNRQVGHLRECLDAIRDSVDDRADFYRIHHLWYVTKDEFLGHQASVRNKLGCEAPGAASHLIAGSTVPDPIKLADELKSLEGMPKIRMFPNFHYEDVVRYYSEKPVITKRCVAPFFKSVIKPNGDVKFCPDEWIDDYVLGNVRNSSFDAIWNSERARNFRAVLFRENQFPGCNRCSWMYSYGWS